MASASRSEQCTRLLFEAVNENSVSKFRLAEETYLPFDLLNSFIKRNEKGEPPLVVALKSGNVSLIDKIVKFLSRNGCRHDADINFASKEWQLMCKKIIDQIFSHQIPIIELIKDLINHDFSESSWLKFIARVFIKSTTFSRQDKIIALELIGATLINKESLMNRLEHDTSTTMSSLGLDCWRAAMTLRYSPPDGEPILPKTSDVPVSSVASSVIFGSVEGEMSREELDLLPWQLRGDLERNSFFFHHIDVRPPSAMQFKIQALLTLRRICSQANHDQLCSFYLKSLLMFGLGVIRENGGEKLFFNSCLLILEQITDPKILSRSSFDVSMETLHYMSKFFLDMLKQSPGYPGRNELSYANLLAPSKFIGTVANFFSKPAMMSEVQFNVFYRTFHFVEIFYRFLCVLESISAQMTRQQNQHLEEYFSNYIQTFFPERTTTVLHVAVGDLKIKLKTIELILKLGANPNATDKKGQTPLHILAGREEIHLEENLPVFQALVIAGTHLDMATYDGDTVLNVLKKNLKGPNQRSLIVHPFYESLLSTVFPLSCYCVRVIRRSGIAFDGDRLPLHLQTFVARHSAKESIEHGDKN